MRGADVHNLNSRIAGLSPDRRQGLFSALADPRRRYSILSAIQRSTVGTSNGVVVAQHGARIVWNRRETDLAKQHRGVRGINRPNSDAVHRGGSALLA